MSGTLIAVCRSDSVFWSAIEFLLESKDLIGFMKAHCSTEERVEDIHGSIIITSDGYIVSEEKFKDYAEIKLYYKCIHKSLGE